MAWLLDPHVETYFSSRVQGSRRSWNTRSATSMLQANCAMPERFEVAQEEGEGRLQRCFDLDPAFAEEYSSAPLRRVPYFFIQKGGWVWGILCYSVSLRFSEAAGCPLPRKGCIFTRHRGKMHTGRGSKRSISSQYALSSKRFKNVVNRMRGVTLSRLAPGSEKPYGVVRLLHH
jgi:hypothetical protein